MPTDVISGMPNIWEISLAMGFLLVGVLYMAWQLKIANNRNTELVDWIRDYAVKAVESNTENATLIDKLTTISDVNDKLMIKEIQEQGSKQVNALKLHTVRIENKLESLRKDE